MIGANAIEILIGLQDNASGKLSNIEKAIVKTSASMKAAGLAMTAAGTATIGILGLWVRKAMETTDMLDRFNAVFGANAAEMQRWAMTTATQLGLNRYELQGFTADFGLFLKNMGFSSVEMRNMSKQLTLLTYDLSEFTGLNPDVVFEKLRRGLAGQGRGLVDLGFKLNEAMLKQFEMNDKLSAAAKTMANYKLILQMTKDAQGAWSNSLNEADNRISIAHNKIKEMTTTIGIFLLPYFATAADYITSLVKKWEALDEATQGNIARLILFGSIGLTVVGVLTLIAGAIRAINLVATPLTLKIIALVLIFDGFYRILAMTALAMGKIAELAGRLLHQRDLIEKGTAMIRFGKEQMELGGVGAIMEQSGIKGMGLGQMVGMAVEAGKVINVNAIFTKTEELKEELGKMAEKTVQ